MEKFVVIEMFNHYAVSNYGRIKNIKSGKILTPTKNQHGYMRYVFCQNGIKKGLVIHRLVAYYFIDNPENKPYVNHKDGNKTNNHVENLEWCTAQENQIHARSIGLINQGKPILATNLTNGETFPFKSVSEAGALLGINKGTISKVLHGKRKSVHGYTFQFL